MDFEHIILEFAHSERLPESAIRASLENPDEFVPKFLLILKNYADGRQISEKEKKAIFFIVHVFGELGEKRAFQPLMDLLCSGNDRAKEVIGDVITESLSRILISTFDGDTNRIYQTIANCEIDDFIRDAAFAVWIYQVLTEKINRDEAFRYLSSFPKLIDAPNGSFIWVSWVNAIADLGFQELSEVAELAFSDGRICADEWGFVAIELRDFRDRLDESLTSSIDEKWMQQNKYWPFKDTIETLSKWHCFSEKYIKHKREALKSLKSSGPMENSYRLVGRNDPCPCGSGKKFKKCCLQ